MRFTFISVAATASLLVIAGVRSRAQQAVFADPRAGAALGQLTVTATVVSSVGVVIGPDGEARVIVANAGDPADKAASVPTPVSVSLAEDCWRTAMPAFEPVGGACRHETRVESNVTVRAR